MQGIFLLQKNVSVIANYVQTVLCYSNTIEGNVIPKTNNETEDFTMKRKMVSALLCATMVPVQFPVLSLVPSLWVF